MIPSEYLEIARSTIDHTLHRTSIDKQDLLQRYPEMIDNKATFVTLKIDHRLRGCIGSLIAHRPLIDDLIANAYSAAFRDPRFTPLTLEELPTVRIEISILSEPKSIQYTDSTDLKSKIHPFKDGVILRLGNHQATFLPQVWEELNDFESFFSHLGLKAGLSSDPLSFHPEIYTYQVESIEES